jgi:hypothetical protein
MNRPSVGINPRSPFTKTGSSTEAEMYVLHSRQTDELELGGCSSEYKELAKLLLAGHGCLQVADVADPSPYDGALAENLSDFGAQSRPGEHWHLEYLPDHVYLGATSQPLVATLTEPDSGR